jgi:two-component system cell cycle response regulator
VSPGPQVDGHTACILIVDDEPDNREVLEIVLGFEQFALLTAATGEEALALVAKTRPDLILCDVMMPGLDGFEVTARLKSDPATSRIPVIIFTALSGHETRARTLRSGAADVMVKPLGREALVTRVKDLLRATYADYCEGVVPAA